MSVAVAATLHGKIILVVEDEYLLATHLAELLKNQGATIVGPAASVQSALSLAEKTASLDAAVLDVNLRGERVYPVADALLARGVPIIFATGYEELLLKGPYIGLPRCPKPYDEEMLVRTLEQMTAK